MIAYKTLACYVARHSRAAVAERNGAERDGMA